MAYTSVGNYFPSQVASDQEKASNEYGLKIARAIQNEWFASNRGGDVRYYLNLDWKPVPILSKFVDIVVNGIADRSFDIKAYSQDAHGVEKRTKYMESLIRDMQTKDLNEFVQQEFGINLFENDPNILPTSKEELELHMQLSYKQGIEIAEETAKECIQETEEALDNLFKVVKAQVIKEAKFFLESDPKVFNSWYRKNINSKMKKID